VKIGWQAERLGDVCAFLNRGISPKYVEQGGICVLNQKCIRDHRVSYEQSRRHDSVAKSVSAERYIQLGDVLVNSTGTGTLGRVAQVRDIPTEPTTVDSHVTIVRPKPGKFFQDFFGYMLIFIEESIKEAGEGCGGQTELARSVLAERFSVCYPTSIDDQKRVVAILDEAFNGIAIAKANVDGNIKKTREVFRSILNSAITGELTREWRLDHSDSKSASEELKDGLVKRCDRAKLTGKYIEPRPPILNKPIDTPESWTLASPEQLSTHIIDCPHSTPKWAELGEICLRTTNFKPGLLNLESVRYVSKETYNERIMRLEPKPDDVLYSREGGILGVACIIPDGLKACLGQRMMQFRIDTNIALPKYFTAVLNSELILSEVRRLTGGAASPHLNIRDIRTFPIPLPPIAEQNEIVKRLEVIIAETQRLESIYQGKLAALDELKKALLHQAFTGQL
jgi:type I restriction enzyme S subunit